MTWSEKKESPHGLIIPGKSWIFTSNSTVTAIDWPSWQATRKVWDGKKMVIGESCRTGGEEEREFCHQSRERTESGIRYFIFHELIVSNPGIYR